MQEHYIKEKVKERSGKIALTGSTDCCCVPGECCSDDGSNNSNSLSALESTTLIGYDSGAPTKFADIKKGEVVDLGSGAGIDVFLSANRVGKSGKVIGIDMTDEMLEKAKKNANNNGYTNVEFRKRDIENKIPVDDNSADLVLSNCVINLTADKVATFREIYRILKKDGGRMMISDLVTDREVDRDSINPDKWCSSIDGALTRENYLDSIRKAGFKNVDVLEEKSYLTDHIDDEKRKISSLVIKAVKY